MFKPIANLLVVMLSGALVLGVLGMKTWDLMEENSQLKQELNEANLLVDQLRRNEVGLKAQLVERQADVAARDSEISSLRGDLAAATACVAGTRQVGAEPDAQAVRPELAEAAGWPTGQSWPSFAGIGVVAAGGLAALARRLVRSNFLQPAGTR